MIPGAQAIVKRVWVNLSAIPKGSIFRPQLLACDNGFDSMIHFAQTCEAVAVTTRKNEKVRLVADYLGSLPSDDAARAATFLTGRAFPRCQEKVLAVGGSLIWQVIRQLAGCDDAAMEEVYRRHGDLGEAAAELLAGKAATGSMELRDIQKAFEELAERRGPTQKRPLLEELISRARPLEAKYIVKIITGDLRIGLKESLVEEAIAQAFGRPLREVQRANMLTGDISLVTHLAAAGKLADASLRLFHPIGFMLASAAETPEEIVETYPGGAWVEDKYDGIRAQAHKQGSRVKIFSRTLDEAVEFHELIPELRALPGEFVLDGEIVAWADGRALPFTELQRRLGRKEPDLWLPIEVPVSFRAFDLLYGNGQLLIDLALGERRQRLEELLPSAAAPAIQLSPMRLCNSTSEIEETFEAALERGNEGLMAKSPDSRYTPGRRGRYWLKLKRPMATLDVVVTAVEFGHGKRHGLLSDYTFAVRDGDRLVNIGKAYSGLTDQEILQLTTYFREHTIEDKGFQRSVEPTVILEVAFNNIQRSNRHESGYALRFPRIIRLRTDKGVSEIDTVERVKAEYERQNKGQEKGNGRTE
jgi:ATP-dependent DNA ligase